MVEGLSNTKILIVTAILTVFMLIVSAFYQSYRINQLESKLKTFSLKECGYFYTHKGFYYHVPCPRNSKGGFDNAYN